MKQCFIICISLILLFDTSNADPTDKELITFCNEIENTDIYQQIVNFTELPMKESLISDLLFLKNPIRSFSYENDGGKLIRVDTIIDSDGNSRFIGYFRDGYLYKFSSEFVYKGKNLFINVKAKQALWTKLLQEIPNSKTTSKLNKKGSLEISHSSTYKERELIIGISIKSYSSKLARVKISFGS